MEVVTRPEILTSEQQINILPQGLTIAEMMAAVSWPEHLRPWTFVTVEGQEVPFALWEGARPKEGRRVVIALRPAGGGGGGGSGKQILTAVASIAIVVAAWYAAPFIVGGLAGMSGATAAAATGWVGAAVKITAAGLAIAGNLALSAFVRPPSLGRATLGSQSTNASPSESNTYSVRGGSNAMNPYGVVPRIFGRHRVTPPFCAEPYVVSSGPSQTINLLLDFGYGPLLVEDIRIGNTPISDFPTARWVLHSHYVQGVPLQIYLNDQATLEVGTVLAQAVDNIRVLPQAGSVATLEFQFPQGLIEFNQQGQSFVRNEHVTVFAAPSADPTNFQPIGNFGPYALFNGEGGFGSSGNVQIRSFGIYEWIRSPVLGFITSDPSAPSIPVGATLVFGGENYTVTGHSTHTTGQPIVQLDRVPSAVSWVFNSVGIIPGREGEAGTVTIVNGSAPPGPLTVTFGPATYDVEFHGQTRTPRSVSVVLTFPYEDSWRILVRRSTPVSGSTLVSNGIVWGTLRSGRWVSPIYPRTTRTILEISITASEQISGQVQNINALVTSILWDPRVQIMRPSRNPALAYLELMTGEANPRRVPFSRMNQTKIMEWADRCDALAPQGDVTATCDIVIDYRATLAEVAQTICSAGRAAPTMVDGQYSVIMEEEDLTPVQMITNRNASSFSSTRTWADFPHALRVKYMSENSWNQEEIFVYADGYSAANASKFETLELAGVVRPWQAWRAGRYYLAAALLRRERLSVMMDVENLVAQRGDLVRVAHDRLLNNAVFRARDFTGQTVTVDGEFDVAASDYPVFSVPYNTYYPANIGPPTSAPFGWNIVGAAGSGLNWQFLDKGTLPDGTDYADVRVFSTSPTSSLTGAFSIRTALSDNQPPTEYIMQDDEFVYTQRLEVLSTTDLSSAPRFWLSVQATNSQGGTGLGHLQLGTDVPLLNPDDQVWFTRTGKPGGTIGATARVIPYFNVQPTVAGAGLDMVVRITGVRLRLQNRKPDLLERVVAQGTNLIPNPGASGAVVGQIFPSAVGALPTGWSLLAATGWTVTVNTVKQVWGYNEIEVRFQAPANQPTLRMAFMPSTPLPPSKIISSSVQLRRIANAGTVPNVRTRVEVRDASDVFLANTDTGNHNVNTSQESRNPQNNVNYSANAAAARYVWQLMILPADTVNPVDMTLRIRMPLSVPGSIEPTATLPAQPDAPAWYADIRNADGDLLSSQRIIDFPASDQFTFNPDTVEQMSRGDIIAIGQINTETSDWLVDKITPGPDFSATLELMEYAPGIFAADAGAIPPYVPNNGTGILGELAGVSNLILSSVLYNYTPDGVPVHTNSLQWDPPPYEVDQYIIYRLYEVLDPGSSPPVPFSQENIKVELARTTEPNYVDEIDTRTLRLNGTTIRYFVVPVAASGRRGMEESVEDVFFPDTMAPPAVNFTTNVLSETTMLIWERPDIPDLGGYQIRFIDQVYQDALGPEVLWENMVSVVDAVSPELTTLTVHTQTGIYGIRAYDTSGNYGPLSFSLTKVQRLPNVNEVTRLVEGPTWTGTFENTEVVDDELRLSVDSGGAYFSEGWFYPDSVVAYPSSWLFRVRGLLEQYALPDTPDPKGDWNVQVWVSIQRSAPTLDDPYFDPLMNASPLSGGPGTFVPLSTVAQTDMVGRQINWALRLRSKRPDLTPSVIKATLVVDHSERREFDNDIQTGTGGLNIPFEFPFFEPPSVAVTLNDGQPGDRIVKSASTTHLTVEVFTSGGISVDRSIDWQAIGYGRGGI